MEDKDRFWKRSLLNDKLASWILAVCAIVLIVSLGAVVIISRCKRVEPHRVEIAFVPMDSIPAWQVSDSAEQATSAFTKTATPSGVDMVMFPRAELDSIVARIETHEAQLAQKYQYIIEKRDEEDNYRNIFMLIFGIAVSTVGFFGYRSFADIEKRAMKVAEEKAEEVAKEQAQKTAKEVAQNTAQNYCSQNVNQLVQSYLAQNLPNEVNSRVNTLFNGEGKEAIVQEVYCELDTRLQNYLNSKDGKALILALIQESQTERPSEPEPPANPELPTVSEETDPVEF